VKVCLFFFLQWRKEDGGVVSGFFRGKEEVAGVRMIMVVPGQKEGKEGRQGDRVSSLSRSLEAGELKEEGNKRTQGEGEPPSLGFSSPPLCCVLLIIIFNIRHPMVSCFLFFWRARR
jgi:hypothetical protein